MDDNEITLLRKVADAALDYYLRQGTGSPRDRKIGDNFHDAVMEYEAWKKQPRPDTTTVSEGKVKE